jgi:predicted transcriptional regulator
MKSSEKKMTVREIAEQLGCTPETVRAHIRVLFPDLMQDGKKTYLNEAQVTVILEKMKHAVKHYDLSNINPTYNDMVIGTETDQSDEFRLAMLYKQNAEIMEEAARLEHKLRIKAEATCSQLAIENNALHEWLRIRNEELINAGLALSDGEDRAALYRRWK